MSATLPRWSSSAQLKLDGLPQSPRLLSSNMASSRSLHATVLKQQQHQQQQLQLPTQQQQQQVLSQQPTRQSPTNAGQQQQQQQNNQVAYKHVIPELSPVSRVSITELFDKSPSIRKNNPTVRVNNTGNHHSHNNNNHNNNLKKDEYYSSNHLIFTMTSDIEEIKQNEYVMRAALNQSSYLKHKKRQDIWKLKQRKAFDYPVTFGNRQGVFSLTERLETFQNKFLLYEKDMIDKYANVDEITEEYRQLTEKTKRRNSAPFRFSNIQDNEEPQNSPEENEKVRKDEQDMTLEEMHEKQKQQDKSSFPVKSWKRKAKKNKAKFMEHERKHELELAPIIPMHEPLELSLISIRRDSPVSGTKESPVEVKDPSNFFLTEVPASRGNNRIRSSTLTTPKDARPPSARSNNSNLSSAKSGANHLDAIVARHHVRDDDDENIRSDSSDDESDLIYLKNYDSRMQLLNIIKRRGTSRPYECLKFPLEEIQQSNKNLEVVKKRGTTFGKVLQYESDDDEQDLNKVFPIITMKSIIPVLSNHTVNHSLQTPPYHLRQSFTGKVEKLEEFERHSSFNNISQIIEGIHHRIGSAPSTTSSTVEDQLDEIGEEERKMIDTFEEASNKCKKMLTELGRIKPKLLVKRGSVEENPNRFPISSSAGSEAHRDLLHSARSSLNTGSSGRKLIMKPPLPPMNQPDSAKEVKQKKRPSTVAESSSRMNGLARYEYGKKRFIAAQAKAQNELLDMLDERDDNRERLFKAKRHLSKVSEQALEHAKSWALYRVHKEDAVKKSAVSAEEKSAISNWKLRNPNAPRPATRTKRDMHSTMWNVARKKLDNEISKFQKSVLFYKRLLVFLDYIHAPSTPIAHDFLTIIRQKLIENPHDLSKSRILFATLAMFATKAPENFDVNTVESSERADNVNSSLSVREGDCMMIHLLFDNKESSKIIQFICTETNVTSQDIQDFEKHFPTHKPVKEMIELKKRIREKEEGNTKKLKERSTKREELPRTPSSVIST